MKKRIICKSCDVVADIRIREANYELDDVEILYCPCCSTEIEDEDDENYD